MEWLEDLVVTIPNILLLLMLVMGIVAIYVNYLNAMKVVEKSRRAIEACEYVIYSSPGGIDSSNLTSCHTPDEDIEITIQDLEAGGSCHSGSVQKPSVTISLPALIKYSETKKHIGMVTCKIG